MFHQWMYFQNNNPANWQMWEMMFQRAGRLREDCAHLGCAMSAKRARIPIIFAFLWINDNSCLSTKLYCWFLCDWMHFRATYILEDCFHLLIKRNYWNWQKQQWHSLVNIVSLWICEYLHGNMKWIKFF